MIIQIFDSREMCLDVFSIDEKSRNVKQTIKDSIKSCKGAARFLVINGREIDLDKNQDWELEMNITEALEIARRTLGSSVDSLYSKMDSGRISADEGFDELVLAGIDTDVASLIVENATGIRV